LFELEYYALLEKNREFFEQALDIASKIKDKARKIFGECEVYITGSYARRSYTLSSDLDVLIVSSTIPEKLSFEWYSDVVKKLTDDYRINIHLLNKRRFKETRRVYHPLIPV